MARIPERIRNAAQPQPGSRASVALQQRLGVDVYTIDPRREVQRGPPTVPTRATDELAADDSIPRPDHDRGEERIRRLQATVVDGDRPVAHDNAGEADHPRVCRPNRGVLINDEVEAPMTGIAADRGKTLVDRPRQRRCQPDAAAVNRHLVNKHGLNQHGLDKHALDQYCL